MPLLCEYFVTHDVFDVSSYTNEEEGSARLEYLKDVFLQEALLRNLRAGEWLSVFKNCDRSWHRRGKELIKKMVKQNRLRLAEKVLSLVPANDVDWCREALASHRACPMNGIITTAQVTNEVGNNQILGRIDRLGSSSFWNCRSVSAHITRNYSNYEQQLQLIMNCSNSVMFIDPHLDPSIRRYNDVLSLILLAKDREILPKIEIHRVVYRGSGRERQLLNSIEWESCFRRAWEKELSLNDMQVEIFVWDDFHDRYLITDLIGIGMGNGFDTTTNHCDMTTWYRMGRKERDDIQREFDSANNYHELKHQFTIP
jgi:hypothetical protein